jgi:hypothetical protein
MHLADIRFLGLQIHMIGWLLLLLLGLGGLVRSARCVLMMGHYFLIMLIEGVQQLYLRLSVLLVFLVGLGFCLYRWLLWMVLVIRRSDEHEVCNSADGIFPLTRGGTALLSGWPGSSLGWWEDYLSTSISQSLKVHGERLLKINHEYLTSVYTRYSLHPLPAETATYRKA